MRNHRRRLVDRWSGSPSRRLGSASRCFSAAAAQAAPTTQHRSPVVRVNQVGYTSSSSKVAFAMLAAAGRPGAVRGHHAVRRRLPGHVHRRPGLVELRLPGGLPAQLLRRCARPGQYQVKLVSPPPRRSPPRSPSATGRSCTASS